MTFTSLKVAAEKKNAEGKKVHEGIGKETSFQVAHHVIEIEPGFNRPISRETVDSIKIAIKSGAVIPPIFVRVDVGRVIMVDGEHRWIAVGELIAEGEDIPFMSAIQFRGDDADAIAHKLRSAKVNGIEPLEQGRDYLKLLRKNWSEQKIADSCGYSVGHVRMCLSLAEANTDVKEQIKNGDIAGTEAAKLLKTHGSKTGEVIEELKVEAAAAGEKKVTAKTIKRHAEKKAPTGPTDRQMLDWIEVNGSFNVKEWYREGQEKFFSITDSDDEKIAEGPNLRAAIRNAMAAAVSA